MSAELKVRTKSFAIACVAFFDTLPKDYASQHFGRQLLRSSTSVAANYRAACRARSDSELFAKLCICEEEADECTFWFELIEQTNRSCPPSALVSEANQLTAMIVTAKKKLRASGKVREEVAPYGPKTETHHPRFLDETDSSTFDLQPSTL